jgi:hypothetical protein
MKRYPNAKVILTIRDNASSWSSSWKVLMSFIEIQERNFSFIYPTFFQWIPFMKDWKRMRSIMGTHIGLKPGELIRDWSTKPHGWLEEQYMKHNEIVISTVSPSSKLLIFNVKEGWNPLCEFLNKDIPDEPFPFVNEASDIKCASVAMLVITYIWIPIVITSVGVIQYSIKKYFK